VPVAQYRRILGETIRAHRKRVGVSQEVLAEKAELNPKYVSEVERGRVNISIDALHRIANALGLRVHALTRDI